MTRQVLSTHHTSSGMIAYVRENGQVRIYKVTAGGMTLVH